MRNVSQVALAATTETSLFDGSQNVAMPLTVVICNRGTTDATIRLRHRVLGEPTNDKQFLYYDFPVLAKDTLKLSFEIGLQPGDIFTAYASTANVSVNCYTE